MNWKRGLNRLFAVFTVLWIAGCMAVALTNNMPWWQPAATAVCVPLGLYVFGAALYWVVAGFARSESKA